MAHQSAVIFFIVWFDMFHLHKFQNCVQDFFILFYPQYAVTLRHRNDLVCPACIESGSQLSITVSANRKLCFIAITERLFHSCCRFHNLIQKFLWNTAQSDQIVAHLVMLKFQLFLIVQCLYLTAPALSRHRTDRLYSVF